MVLVQPAVQALNLQLQRAEHLVLEEEAAITVQEVLQELGDFTAEAEAAVQRRGQVKAV